MSERICPTPVDAILLCGNDSKPGLGGKNKFELRVGGDRNILESTLDALEHTKLIDRIFIVAPISDIKNNTIPKQKEYILIESGGDLVNNVSAGIEKQQQRGGQQHALIVCSDLPFLTSQSLDWLIINSQPDGNTGAIKMPVVPHKIIQQLSPTYETYFYPMKEFSFKMGNNIFININLLSEERIKQFVVDYRKSGSDDYILMSLKRITLLQKYGGTEAVYTVIVNLLSKLLQIKCGTRQDIPLSGLRKMTDYQKVISLMLGHKVELLASPLVDTVLDVDNTVRLGIFQRGYERISQIVKKQADAYTSNY